LGKVISNIFLTFASLKIVRDMSWVYLVIAGLLEIGFTTCMGKIRETSGSLMYVWGIVFLTCMVGSMFCLQKALSEIPLGTAYAVWTGIGVVVTVLVGIIYFKEPTAFWRLFFVFTLIGSIIGLKVVSSH
jgi:hypothetical protein